MHCACAYCCLRDSICKLQRHGLTCSGRVGHLHDDPANTKTIRIDCGKWRETAASFITWLDSVEKTICDQKQVSRVLEKVLAEMDKQEVLENEINRSKLVMDSLGRQATILFDQCFEKDDNLVKDLIRVLKMRWGKVLSKSRKRLKELNNGYKQASNYENSWRTLVSWLEGEERALDYLAKQTSSAAKNKGKLESLKAKLTKTKRSINAKKGQYDSVVCSGNALREKAPKDDEAELKKMSDRLEQLWNTVNSKAKIRKQDLDKSLGNPRAVSPETQEKRRKSPSPHRRSTSAEPTFGAEPKRSLTPEVRKMNDQDAGQKPRERSSTDSSPEINVQKTVSFI